MEESSTLLLDTFYQDLISYYPDASLRVFNGFFMMLLFDHPLLPFVWTFLFEVVRMFFYFFIVPVDFAIETRGNLYFLYAMWLAIGILASYPVSRMLALHYPLIYHRDYNKGLFYPLLDTLRNPKAPRNAIIWKYYSLYWSVFLMQYPVCYVLDTDDMSMADRCQNGRLSSREGIIEVGNFVSNGLVVILLIIFAFVTVDYEKGRFKRESGRNRYLSLFIVISTWHVYLFVVGFFVPNNSSAFYGTGAFILGALILVLEYHLFRYMEWTPIFEEAEKASMEASDYLTDYMILEGFSGKRYASVAIEEQNSLNEQRTQANSKFSGPVVTRFHAEMRRSGNDVTTGLNKIKNRNTIK